MMTTIPLKISFVGKLGFFRYLGTMDSLRKFFLGVCLGDNAMTEKINQASDNSLVKTVADCCLANLATLEITAFIFILSNNSRLRYDFHVWNNAPRITDPNTLSKESSRICTKYGQLVKLVGEKGLSYDQANDILTEMEADVLTVLKKHDSINARYFIKFLILPDSFKVYLVESPHFVVHSINNVKKALSLLGFNFAAEEIIILNTFTQP